jgi:hypothetical protein
MDRRLGRFVWDMDREAANIAKHSVDFTTAMKVFILLRRKPRAFKPGDECAGCSRSIMRPMGFLLRRIPPTGEWKLRALARRASLM